METVSLERHVECRWGVIVVELLVVMVMVVVESGGD